MLILQNTLSKFLACCAGERGEYWLASKTSYENTLTKIKMDGKLSSNISETLDVFFPYSSVFGNPDRNPDRKIFSIMKYLIETSDENSRTLAVHI